MMSKCTLCLRKHSPDEIWVPRRFKEDCLKRTLGDYTYCVCIGNHYYLPQFIRYLSLTIFSIIK